MPIKATYQREETDPCPLDMSNIEDLAEQHGVVVWSSQRQDQFWAAVPGKRDRPVMQFIDCGVIVCVNLVTGGMGIIPDEAALADCFDMMSRTFDISTLN